MPEVNMMVIFLLVILLAMRAIDAQNECPNRNAVCINIRDCPLMVEILKRPRPLSTADLATLRNSQCGWDGNDPKVCCGNQVTTTTTATIMETIPEGEIPDPPDVTNHANLRLLNHQSCGPITQQKVIGGNKTGVFDYPWMALLAYDVGRGETEFRCDGTLISERYVLTAAHCVTSLPRNLNLVGVRIGDHDITTEPDCERDDRGFEVQCAEKHQDFSVEDFHFHPEYTRTKLQNDIALVRLNESVDFRPLNVKPICLPFGSAAQLNKNRAIVTGWGATELGPRSMTLLQAKLPLVSNEQCKETYKRISTIWHKQMCAGGQSMVDSCLGDSGGPLQAPGIYRGNTIRTIQYGIVSYGLRQCGTAGFPGIYTKVSYYMDWILDTMTD